MIRGKKNFMVRKRKSKVSMNDACMVFDDLIEIVTIHRSCDGRPIQRIKFTYASFGGRVGQTSRDHDRIGSMWLTEMQEKNDPTSVHDALKHMFHHCTGLGTCGTCIRMAREALPRVRMAATSGSSGTYLDPSAGGERRYFPDPNTR